MLEHLFGSRTRVKLLSLFLRHPEEPLFVREITRRIDTQINAVRRELSNLVRFGLISEKHVANEDVVAQDKKQPGLKKKFYQVNPSFVLLPELTALLLKAQVLLEKKLDREITKLGDVRYLSLSGLFLGRQNPSPVDMFIVGKVDKEALSDLMKGIEKELGFDLNFSYMSSEEFEYRKDIADRFLTKILEAPKNVMVDRLNERT
ncbi:helix-turn-helix transcriptional regulator [Candidatus Uhrbacteria bacterium]|nr:helix-turn-helix transcriptional regulator [Candidatus Uhrbacteria bacterium]